MASPPSRPRLADIARVANVSPMAVAAVLTGAGGGRVRVAKATAERVRSIAQQMNYRPNIAAQQLSGRPSRILGVVGHNWFESMPVRVLSWLNKIADEQGYRVISSQTNGRGESLRDYVDECSARGVDGVIYVAHADDGAWGVAKQAFKPMSRVVTLMGDPGIRHAHRVLSDNAGGVELAVGHLHRTGRRRIVQVLEDMEFQVNRQRLEGMQRAFNKLGLNFTEQSVCVETKGWPPGSPRFDELVQELVLNRKADAVIADSDSGAVSFMNALRRRGIRPGEDVAVIGWGHDLWGMLAEPMLTTIHLGLDRLAAHAIRLILEQIDHREKNPTPQHILVPQDLDIRGSA